MIKRYVVTITMDQDKEENKEVNSEDSNKSEDNLTLVTKNSTRKKSRTTSLWSILKGAFGIVFAAMGKILKFFGLFGIIFLIVILSSQGEAKNYEERSIIPCYDEELSNLSKSGKKERKEFCEEKSNLDRIAVIDVSGVLDTESTTGNGVTVPSTNSIESIKRFLDIAQNDKSVKAIVLKINSGGGTALASRELYEKVKETNNKKRIYAYIENFGASGAYMTALGSEEIVANEESIVGSVGSIIYFENFSGLMEKLGVEVDVIKSGELKDAGNPFSSEKNHEEVYGSIVAESFQRFADIFDEERSGSVNAESRDEILKGGVFSATKAKELGMVDKVMSFDDFLDELKEKYDISDRRYEVFEYQNKENFLSQLFNGVSNQSISIFGIKLSKEYTQDITKSPRAAIWYIWEGAITE